jgi:hypothetical protein
LTELREEVREGLRNLNALVTGIDARLRDLELWRAGQTSAENVVQQALDHEHSERGLVLSSKQVNIALGSVVISALAFTASVIALIVMR